MSTYHHDSPSGEFLDAAVDVPDADWPAFRDDNQYRNEILEQADLARAYAKENPE